jgi:uncharacterized protein YkwD
MNLNRWKFIQGVAVIIFRTLLTSFIIVLTMFAAFGIYDFAYKKGYVEGQKSMDEYISQIFTQSDATSYEIQEGVPKPTIVLSPTVKKVSQGVSWGGPELWEAVNKKRVEYGVNPLRRTDELCTIASIRLNELLELGKLDGHEGFGNMTERRTDLKWIFDKYSTIAEFLAYGGLTPSETIGLWDNTLGHKKLLNGGEYVWGCIYAQNTFAVAITAY